MCFLVCILCIFHLVSVKVHHFVGEEMKKKRFRCRVTWLYQGLCFSTAGYCVGSCFFEGTLKVRSWGWTSRMSKPRQKCIVKKPFEATNSKQVLRMVIGPEYYEDMIGHPCIILWHYCIWRWMTPLSETHTCFLAAWLTPLLDISFSGVQRLWYDWYTCMSS